MNLRGMGYKSPTHQMLYNVLNKLKIPLPWAYRQLTPTGVTSPVPAGGSERGSRQWKVVLSLQEWVDVHTDWLAAHGRFSESVP